jgi:hypothetical protein
MTGPNSFHRSLERALLRLAEAERHDHQESAVPPVGQSARVRRLVDLMARRPDLEGVYPPADIAVAAVLWSA